MEKPVSLKHIKKLEPVKMEFKSNSPVKEGHKTDNTLSGDAKILKKFIKQNHPSELDTSALEPINHESDARIDPHQVTLRLPPKGRYVNKSGPNTLGKKGLQPPDSRKIMMDLQNMENGFSSRSEIQAKPQ
jgi:hypothetical protein